MVAVYRPAEPELRQLIAQILVNKSDRNSLTELGNALSKAIGKFEDATLPLNTRLIRVMATKLQTLVADQPKPG
jgi:hypothetical protein